MSALLPRRVLIVEDDPTIVANLVEYLEGRGLAVDSAFDGAAAFSFARDGVARGSSVPGNAPASDALATTYTGCA